MFDAINLISQLYHAANPQVVQCMHVLAGGASEDSSQLKPLNCLIVAEDVNALQRLIHSSGQLAPGYVSGAPTISA